MTFPELAAQIARLQDKNAQALSQAEELVNELKDQEDRIGLLANSLSKMEGEMRQVIHPSKADA